MYELKFCALSRLLLILSALSKRRVRSGRRLIFLTSERHMRSEAPNPIEPDVVIPVVRYFSSIKSSHTLANLLLGSLVMATVFTAFFFAILAARILSIVLPDIDIKYAVLLFTISGLINMSEG
jgi:hypothetical protein